MRRRLSAEAWMRLAWCAQLPGLPWTADPDKVIPAGEVAMTSVCGACPVQVACAEYVACERVSSGFWAGQHRDPRADRTCLDDDGSRAGIGEEVA